MNEYKLNGESKDILAENISKLKDIFPEIVTEDKIDFDKLKLILGENVETDRERYNFTWPGKTQAIKESQKQSTGTLRPCKEESKNWDTTQNLYIEGDNLEVLKLLQKTYYNKIKMIYIDPPYNTGNDFIYPDNYKDNIENYLEITGQSSKLNGEEFSKISTNTETNGRYHSNWLNMMYPRLKLAKNLLKDDGVIFISIDENELENLKKICNEIFGEENFISNFTWINKPEGRQLTQYGSVNTHEYILCYSKEINNIHQFKYSLSFLNRLMPNTYKNNNNNKILTDEYGDYIITHELNNGNSAFNEITRPNLVFDIYYNPKTEEVLCENVSQNHIHKDFIKISPKNNKAGNTKFRAWRWSKNKVINQKQDLEFIRKDDSYSIYTKRRNFDSANIKDIITNINTNKGNLDMNKLNLKKYFDFPKPVDLIKFIISFIVNDDEVILDFFSGSGTMSQACLELNNEDNKKRKFILIQLPEKIKKKSEAYKAGYKNICEIGKERIRRAGDKILEESDNKDLDIGFKVFKLDSSNLQKWDPDYKNLTESLDNYVDNIKTDRTEEDLVYEIMLKYGIDLTLPIQKENTENHTIYSIGHGALLICLDDNITKDITKPIIDLSKDSVSTRVVFKDNGFKSDSDKTNIKETLKVNNIEEFITI